MTARNTQYDSIESKSQTGIALTEWWGRIRFVGRK